jgi:hypothetical protein
MSVCGDSLLRLVVDVGREAGMLRTSWRVISLIVGRVGPTLIAGHSTEIAHPASLSLSLQTVPVVLFSYAAVSFGYRRDVYSLQTFPMIHGSPHSCRPISLVLENAGRRDYDNDAHHLDYCCW